MNKNNIAENNKQNHNEREIWIENGAKKIYGKAFIPANGKSFPLVIYAHELLHTHKTGWEYAKFFANNGIAVYIFDFCGGSIESKSEGKLTEMSLMTETDDIEAIYHEALKWDFVDSDKVILLGSSQGGAVATIAATRNPEWFKGLIVMYPPYQIGERVHELFYSKENVPKTFSVRGWCTVGDVYALDVWDYDIFEEMKKYKKPVLMLHGDSDGVIDISISQRAEKAFPNAELLVMEGGGHIFRGEVREKAMLCIMEYIRNILR